MHARAHDGGRGLGSAVANTAGIDMLDQQFGFNSFVAGTGGELFYGRNDLDRCIADSTARGTDFYTLTYVPPSSFDDNSFHSLRIVMRDPALHVTTRRGFYSTPELPTDPNVKDLGFDLKLAATGQMTFASIGTRIAGVSAAGHGSVSLNISIDDSGLQWTPRADGGDTAKITVLLVSLDKNREIQTSTAYTMDLAVKSPTEVATGRVEFIKQLALNSKSQFVRLIVRDASGRIGTADADAAALASLLGHH